MKKKKILLWILLCLVPSLVFASSSSDDMPLGVAIFMEAFVSIHMTVFVLMPLSNLFGGDDPKGLLKKLFIGRIAILLFCDIFITPFIAILDFFAVFVGAFLIVPICGGIKKTNPYSGTTKVTFIGQRNTSPITKNVSGIVLKCVQCNQEVPVTAKFCPKCGLSMTGNNIKVESSPMGGINVPAKESVLPSHFDSMYSLTEDKMLEEFLNRELAKASINQDSKLIPSDILKRRKVLNVIFALLMFIYISMIFFHFPIAAYAIGAVILVIFYKVSRSYNLIKYLKKEVKSRPSEKVSNIVMTVKSTFVQDNSKGPFFIVSVLAIILPLIIFWNPRILYEKVDDGYAVRFYIFGVTNFKTATIPATYKGKNVVSLRGNTFSNMPLLEEVILPDTIVEIRGQVFKNDKNLVKVNIPSKLEYLGGGAFYNCSSIKEIELPDTLTYLGGEAFYGASSLESIKLSNQLTEIRGNTFEYCTSLKSVIIPDSVTRIGGHAFYGASNLEEVYISPDSQLNEIGSSAFRLCSALDVIRLPEGVSINERAFKESPTEIYTYKATTFYAPYDGRYTDTKEYGRISLYVSNYRLVDGKMHVTLQAYGQAISKEYDLRCDGSTYYIQDKLSVTTRNYDTLENSVDLYFMQY